jgi:hypothetical protein
MSKVTYEYLFGNEPLYLTSNAVIYIGSRQIHF